MNHLVPSGANSFVNKQIEDKLEASNLQIVTETHPAAHAAEHIQLPQNNVQIRSGSGLRGLVLLFSPLPTGERLSVWTLRILLEKRKTNPTTLAPAFFTLGKKSPKIP